MSTSKKTNSAMAFKIAFRGYSKESVNEYIATANAQREQEASELKAEIEAMRDAADAAKSDKERAVSKISQLELERDAAVSKLDDIEKKLKEAIAKIDEYEQEIEILKNKIEMSTNTENDRNKRASAVLNDAMSVSENLISSARREAREIKRQAELELELARGAVRKSANDAMQDINRMIDNAAEEASAEISSAAQEAEDAAARMNGEIAEKSNKVVNKVSHIRSVLGADVENRIAQMSFDEQILTKTPVTPKQSESKVPPSSKHPKPAKSSVSQQTKKGFALSSVFGFKK